MTIELAQPDPPTANVVLTFTYYPDKAGKWRWRCRAPNGKIVAVSGETFYNKASAERAATRMAAYFAQEVQVVTGVQAKQKKQTRFSEPYWPFIIQGRARWGRITPYRLGRMLGDAGSDLPNPYDPGSIGYKHFQQGRDAAPQKQEPA